MCVHRPEGTHHGAKLHPWQERGPLHQTHPEVSMFMYKPEEKEKQFQLNASVCNLFITTSLSSSIQDHSDDGTVCGAY